jgi:hypothetical protein
MSISSSNFLHVTEIVRPSHEQHFTNHYYTHRLVFPVTVIFQQQTFLSIFLHCLACPIGPCDTAPGGTQKKTLLPTIPLLLHDITITTDPHNIMSHVTVLFPSNSCFCYLHNPGFQWKCHNIVACTVGGTCH